MNKKIFFLLLFCPLFLQAQLSNQQQTELKALNNYLQFTNESTHGLLIVHRLLEILNQKVNKYVDQDSYQLNFYSNADLPKNIFEDPEHMFFSGKNTPYEWYDIALAEGKILPASIAAQLKSESAKMKTIINRVNAVRFDLDDLIKSDDLKERKNLAQIYKILEECVQLYNDFYNRKKRLKTTIKKRYLALNIANDQKELGNIIAIYENMQAFLEGVRNEDATNLSALVQHLKNNLTTAERFGIADRTYKNVLQKSATFGQVAEKYLADGAFPSEYKLYGKTYYYFNLELVSKFNYYGSGMVADINQWIADKKYPALVQLEEPPFFKVIYPKREVRKPEAVSKIKANKIPQKLENREVVIKQKQIYVSPGTVTIEVYDHQLSDGDIISLNYNGHWILEKYQLRRKAKKMTLPLKPTNDNYLILHAVNMGEKPPNTATLSYTYKGERKSIVMESDMDESEMIQINIKQ